MNGFLCRFSSLSSRSLCCAWYCCKTKPITLVVYTQTICRFRIIPLTASSMRRGQFWGYIWQRLNFCTISKSLGIEINFLGCINYQMFTFNENNWRIFLPRLCTGTHMHSRKIVADEVFQGFHFTQGPLPIFGLTNCSIELSCNVAVFKHECILCKHCLGRVSRDYVIRFESPDSDMNGVFFSDSYLDLLLNVPTESAIPKLSPSPNLFTFSILWARQCSDQGSFVLGAELLPKGYEGRHMRTSQSQSLQRTSCVPIGQRWVSQGARDALQYVAQRSRRYAVPPGRESGFPVLHRVWIAGSDTGRRGGSYT